MPLQLAYQTRTAVNLTAYHRLVHLAFDLDDQRVLLEVWTWADKASFDATLEPVAKRVFACTKPAELAAYFNWWQVQAVAPFRIAQQYLRDRLLIGATEVA